MILNTQPKERPLYSPDGRLEVIKLFPTIQGEGPFAGTPAIFIRLAGCSLDCRGCDTQYTQGRYWENPDMIASTAIGLAIISKISLNPLAVITGGEPLRQNLDPLCHELIDQHRFRVQIETNGIHSPTEAITCFSQLSENGKLTLVCSPKTKKVHYHTRALCDNWKYILKADEVDEKDGLPTSSLYCGVRPARPPERSGIEVFVQPMDEQDEKKNQLNTQAAVDSCMKYGYRLSLQTHKILNLP